MSFWPDATLFLFLLIRFLLYFLLPLPILTFLPSSISILTSFQTMFLHISNSILSNSILTAFKLYSYIFQTLFFFKLYSYSNTILNLKLYFLHLSNFSQAPFLHLSNPSSLFCSSFLLSTLTCTLSLFSAFLLLYLY